MHPFPGVISLEDFRTVNLPGLVEVLPRCPERRPAEHRESMSVSVKKRLNEAEIETRTHDAGVSNSRRASFLAPVSENTADAYLFTTV